MDYAAALNEEIKDLFRHGADVVQVDEPYMQARPEKAREYGVAALNRALEGVAGTTAVHICFGYAHIAHVRPSGYSFLPELAGCCCRQISIETAQANLDCRVLEQLPGKQIMVGCLDLGRMDVETPEVVAELAWVIDRAEDHLGPERAERYLRKFYPWYGERLQPPAEVAEELQRSADLNRARELVAALGQPAGVA